MDTKTCGQCGKTKPITEFLPNKGKVDGLRSDCEACHKEYNKGWYEANKQRVKNRTKNQRLVHRKVVLEHLLANHCIDCGEADPIVLEFDHVRGEKSFTISTKAGHVTTERLLAEIVKCDVRCANCHRRKTAKENNWHWHQTK